MEIAFLAIIVAWALLKVLFSCVWIPKVEVAVIARPV
jgi:hypothetical protein